MTIPDDKVDKIIECLSEIEFSIKRIVQFIYIFSAGLFIWIFSAGLVIWLGLRLVFN